MLPGNPDVVHHVILFQVAPEQVAAAEAKDAAEDDEGWTCFGGTGLDRFQDVNRSSWIGAWAPGGKETVTKPGFGVRLEKGSRIVMQVHYNLLAGQEPDTSAAPARASGKRLYQALTTMLLPAPVEAAVPAAALGRTAVRPRRGPRRRQGALRRGGQHRRPAPPALRRRAAAGHHPVVPAHPRRADHHPRRGRSLHLLGRSIKIEVWPGTPQAQTILDIPVWDFDDQGARPIEPITLQPFEQVKVTCTHVQWLRNKLPAFEGQPDRYVVWGEGTTDEMCLGMLQVTRP